MFTNKSTLSSERTNDTLPTFSLFTPAHKQTTTWALEEGMIEAQKVE